MQHKIITLPTSHFRALARDRLTGQWPRVVIGTLIYNLVISALGIILTLLGRVDTSFLTLVYALLVGGPAALGYCCFILKSYRREPVGFLDVFFGFERFVPAFLLGLFISLFTTLWTLLFIIPGIVASYRYSMSFYIMYDHPEYESNHCLEESKRLMWGNKAKLFFLHCSFLGWYFLIIFVVLILSAVMGSVFFSGFASNSSVLAVLRIFLAGVPLLILSAYQEMAVGAFYEELTMPIFTSSENEAGYQNYQDHYNNSGAF